MQPWPLFSLQPSLLDADFVKRELVPFDERARLPEAHWLWELEAAIRFVRAGGIKASLSTGPFAVQIPVPSSSRPPDPPPPRRKFTWHTDDSNAIQNRETLLSREKP